MKRFTLAPAALLATLFCASVSRAATPLPPAPPSGYCYDSWGDVGFIGVRACPGTPPPTDPGAYTTASVTWLVHGARVPHQTDVTQFWNTFGHVDPAYPVQPWPGVSGTTVTMTDTSARYYRERLAMPMNPGTLSHFLKATSGYEGPTFRARFALVPAGAPWPTGPDTNCYKTNQPFSNQTVLNVNPGAPNTAKCSVAAGQSYDILIDSQTSGTIALTWN